MQIGAEAMLKVPGRSLLPIHRPKGKIGRASWRERPEPLALSAIGSHVQEWPAGTPGSPSTPPEAPPVWSPARRRCRGLPAMLRQASQPTAPKALSWRERHRKPGAQLGAECARSIRERDQLALTAIG